MPGPDKVFQPGDALKGESREFGLGHRPGHPVEKIEKSFFRQRDDDELQRATLSSGLAFASAMKMDRANAACSTRLPGMNSSMVGLETLMGLDTELTAADIYGGNDLNPEPLHRNKLPCDIMEERMGN